MRNVAVIESEHEKNLEILNINRLLRCLMTERKEIDESGNNTLCRRGYSE